MEVVHQPQHESQYGNDANHEEVYYEDEEVYEEEEYYEEDEEVLVEEEPVEEPVEIVVADGDGDDAAEEFIEQVFEDEAVPMGAAVGGMAAMIAAAASNRNDRIDAGGEVQVRVVPEQHKTLFISVADEAASFGKLLNGKKEKVVEAIAPEKKAEAEWAGPGGLRLDSLRPNHRTVIHEAAALGQMRRLKPVEVTNYDATNGSKSLDDDEEEDEDFDNKMDDNGRRLARQQFLVDHHLKMQQKNKDQGWAPENNMHIEYKSLDDVKLPTRRLPKFNAKKATSTIDSISQAAAVKAWERRSRLDRPNAPIHVTTKCTCPYCPNPNPYQTHAYKKLRMDRSQNPNWEEEEARIQQEEEVQRHQKPVKAQTWGSTAAPAWTPSSPKSKPLPTLKASSDKVDVVKRRIARAKAEKEAQERKAAEEQLRKQTERLKHAPRVVVPEAPPIVERTRKPEPVPEPEPEVVAPSPPPSPPAPKSPSNNKKRKKSKKKKKKKKGQADDGCACIIL